MKTLNEHIDACAQSICDYIQGASQVDLEEIKRMVKLEFKFSIEAAMRSEFDVIADRMRKLAAEQADPYTSKARKIYIRDEMERLSARKTQIKRAVTENKDRVELEQLKWYVRTKFGEESLKAYYDLVGKSKPFNQ